MFISGKAAARAAALGRGAAGARSFPVASSTFYRSLVTSATQGSVVLCDVPEWQTDIEGINSDVLVIDATTAPLGFRGLSLCWGSCVESSRWCDPNHFAPPMADLTLPHPQSTWT